MKNLIKQFQKVHGNKYNYDKVVYNNCRTKICIICQEHGEFWQLPLNHRNGQGCPDCGKKDQVRQVQNEEFIRRLVDKYGNQYNFDKTIFRGTKKRIIVTCKQHGDFEVFPFNFLKGKGCPKCVNERVSNERRNDFDKIVQKFNKVHNFKYDYSNSVYQNYCKKIEIICSKHGSFWQSVSDHIKGRGCPICKSSKGEIIVSNILLKKQIEFIPQKRFEECKLFKPLAFDFFLPKNNTCIEYNGIQHYESLDYFGGKQELEEIQKRDAIKIKFCKDNNIKLIIIPYWKLDEIENILKGFLL